MIVALPHIDDDLSLGLAGQQWVILAYAVALSALYLPSGAIGDRFGLRRTFVIGLTLFALGVVRLCRRNLRDRARSPVVSSRVSAGPRSRRRAWPCSESSGRVRKVARSGSGPRSRALRRLPARRSGGVVVEVVSWRWIFLLNIPLAVVTVVLALMGRTDGERALRASDARSGRLGARGTDTRLGLVRPRRARAARASAR